MENPGIEDVYEVGTVGRVQKMIKLPDGRIKALVQGIVKARAVTWLKKRGYFKVEVTFLEEQDPEEIDIQLEALMRNVKENSEKLLALKGELPEISGTFCPILIHRVNWRIWWRPTSTCAPKMPRICWNFSTPLNG